MTATPTLNGYSRYSPPGVRQYYFVTAIANPAVPTRSELAAGHDLTPEVVDGSVNGFYPNTDTIDVPDAGTKFTSQIDGRSKSDKSSVGIYLSDDGDDARTLLTYGTNGFFCIFPEGDHDDLTVDIFPVRVLRTPKDTGMDKGAQMTLAFAITADVHLDIAVPATS